MSNPISKAKQLAKWLLGAAGLNVSRGPLNRFDLTRETILHLRARGYIPRVVIDAGANVGRWASMARAIFPESSFHLIEAQPACLRALELVSQQIGAASVVGCALAQPGLESVTMVGSGADSTSEGAWVPMRPDEQSMDTLTVRATTLDALFGGRFTAADRVFLKLDIEGQEFNALSGATQVLAQVEVILTEVRFYDFNHSGHPTFDDVSALLRDRGFVFYDMARLVSRARDGRLYLGDVLFVRCGSALLDDVQWK